MATRTISTRLAIEGESAYRQSIANINSSLSNHQQQLKLVQSEYQNHQNSMAALQAKETALKTVQSDLTAKVKECQTAYQNAQSALASYQSKTETLKSALERNKTALAALDSETRMAGTQWAEYNAKVKDAEDRLKELENTTGDTSKEEESLRKVISESQEAMAKLEAETDGAAKTAGELITEQRGLTSELEQAKAGQEAATKACNSWQKQEASAQIQLNNTTAELELNQKYMDEAKASTDGCATSIDAFGKRVKETGDSTMDAAEATQALASVVASAGLLQGVKNLANALMDCANAAGEFYAQMSTVEAISGATSEEMEQLTAAAKQMGATTSFTATEAGQALEYMAMAGWSADEMLDGLAGVMNLAAAEGGDLATVSDIVTDALTAFGLAASDSAHFSDVLAKASSSSNTTVSMLGESFQMVGTTAGALGYSIEDVSVALGAMANMGIKGQTAGTGLATAFTRMSGTNENATTAMEALGLSMYDTNGKARDLSDFLDDLRAAFADMTDQEKESYAYLLAGQKGMKGLLAIVNTSVDDWDNLTEAIANCNGASALMAATKLDNYAGQITLLESAMDGLSVSVGEVLTPVLGDLAEAATAVLNEANTFVNSNPEAVAAIAGLVVSLGSMLAGVTALTVALPLLQKTLTAVSAAAAANPLGMIAVGAAAAIAGITALVGAVHSYINEQKTAVNEAKALREQLESTKEAYEELTAENEAAAKNTKALANELKTLTEKENRDWDEKARLKDIVAQLNQAIPGLALAYDEETDSINMTTEALEAMAKAQQEQTEYQTAEARMNELLNEQAAIKTKLAEQEAVLAEAQGKTISLVRDLNEENTLAGMLGAQFIKMTDEQVLAYEAAEEAVSDYSEQLAENEAELAELTEYINDYNDAQEETDDTTAIVISAAENLAECLIVLEQNYNDAYDAALESIQGQMSIWDEMGDAVEVSLDKIIANMTDQTEYYQNYSANLDSLRARNIEGLSEFLVASNDGTQEYIAMVGEMAEADDDTIQRMIAVYSGLEDSQESVATSVAELATSYSKTTEQWIQDCVDSINDSNMPEEAKKVALDTLRSYVSGIDEASDDSKQAVYQVSKSHVDAFARACGFTIFEQMGEDTVSGFEAGITGKSGSLSQTMMGFADTVAKTPRGPLEINSPSKLFQRYGEYTVEGFINGIEGEQDSVGTTMSNLAKSAIGAFTKIATGSALKRTGLNTASGFTSGVQAKKSTTLSTMASLASSALKSFQQKSTSSSLTGTGAATIQGYINGTNSKLSTATSKMQAIASMAIAKFSAKSTGTSLYSTGSNTMQGYVNGTNAKLATATSKMQAIASAAVSKFKNSSTSSSLYSAGTNTLQGYINGLSSKSSSLYSKMSSIAKSAISKFKKTLGIASPSKVFAELGGYTAEGYTEGLNARQASVNATMANMAKTASEAFSSGLSYDVGGLSEKAMGAYGGALSLPSQWAGELEQTLHLEIPIYVDNKYSKTEILEIALSGISKRQAARAAAKGAYA